MQFYRRLMGYCNYDRLNCILGIIYLTYFHLYAFIATVITKEIVDSIQLKDRNQLKYYCIVFACAGIVQYMLIFIIQPRFQIFWSNITFGLYNTYLPKLITLDNNLYESLGTGKIQSLFGSGISNIYSTITTIFNQGINICITFLASIGLIRYYFGLGLVLLFIGLIIIFYYLSLLSIKVLKTIRAEIKDLTVDTDRRITKILMSKIEIVQGDTIQIELDSMNKVKNKLKTLRIQEFYFSAIKARIPQVVFEIIKISLYAYFGYMTIEGHHSIGELVLLVAIFEKMSNFIQTFATYNDLIQGVRIHIEKFREIFAMKSIVGYNTGSDYNYIHGDIDLDDISYSYNKQHIYKKLKLHIQGGTKIALVGNSGGGKSTLAKLIAGYIHHNSGSIRIDKQELPNQDGSNNHINLKSFYQQVGYLTQEPLVFDGTIRENLIYGITNFRSAKDLEHILGKVILQAKCEWIYNLQDGIETQIGEKGIKLSGGQRQRLAIAKLMLKNPQIIIMDEPTSSLDSISETEVISALDSLFQNKTVIIIAHRLQTIKKSDRILVIENGEIIEDGNHKTLTALGGFYAKMVDLQSGF